MNITEIITKYSSVVDQQQGPRLIIDSFDTYMFSFGVFKVVTELYQTKLDLYQVFGPLGIKPFPAITNTLLFAIDPKYKDFDFPDQFVYNSITLYKTTRVNGAIYFYSREYHIALIFVGERIDSQYYTEDRTFKSFKKTFKCIPDIILHGHRNYWVDLYYFISYLINKGKKVVINNWAFLSFRDPNTIKSFKKNEFFEFFPELGFIINIIAITNPNAESIFVTNWTRDKVHPSVFRKHNPKLYEWLTAVPYYANSFTVRQSSQQLPRPNQLQRAAARLVQLGIEFPIDEPQQGYAWQSSDVI